MSSVPVEATKNEIRIMDREAGDLKISWSEGNKDEVAAAKQAFEKAKKDGLLIYRQTRSGDKGEVMQTFDPSAERIIAAPRHVGG